jgi:hypothetical protein
MPNPTVFRLEGRPGETFTVTATDAAQSFSSAQRTRNSSHAIACYISVDTQSIKFTLGGSTPVSSGLGHTLTVANGILLLESPALIHDFSFINAVAQSAGILQITMLFESGVDLT